MPTVASKPGTLTPKEQLFVDEYLIDQNGSAAARRAGYSLRTAHVICQDVLARPRVQAAIAKAMAERSKRTKVDADWVLRRLEAEASADIAELLKPDGSYRPVAEWPEIFRKGLVAGFKSAQVKRGNRTVTVITEVRLADRGPVVERIGKHVDVQAFKDKVDMTLSYEAMTDEEISARKAEVLSRLQALLANRKAAEK